jgi:tetratricopeptide (TPR) repeat protein
MKKLFSRYAMMTEVIQILQVLDRLRPYDEDVQWQLAQAYTKVNDWNKAVVAYKTIREITPMYDGLVLIRMGEIYINNLNQPKEGIKLLLEALEFIEESIRKGTELLVIDIGDAERIDILTVIGNTCIEINESEYMLIQEKCGEKILELDPANVYGVQIVNNARQRIMALKSK